MQLNISQQSNNLECGAEHGIYYLRLLAPFCSGLTEAAFFFRSEVEKMLVIPEGTGKSVTQPDASSEGDLVWTKFCLCFRTSGSSFSLTWVIKFCSLHDLGRVPAYLLGCTGPSSLLTRQEGIF